MYEAQLRLADIKVRHKLDRFFERLFLLEFESCLVKENVSREQLLIKNYKDNDTAPIGADFEPSYTFRQLCNFGRDLADKITKAIQATHSSQFETSVAALEEKREVKHSVGVKEGDNLMRLHLASKALSLMQDMLLMHERELKVKYKEMTQQIERIHGL
jgi:hypothetical protein